MNGSCFNAMSRDEKLWFVIAAFNEGPMIAEVVRGVSPHAHVVVVDDGSADDTGDQALAGGACVATHLVNRGQGAALQTGIDFALAQGAGHVVTFDADGQHDVDEALEMVARCRAEGLDAVLGSRFLGATVNMPFSRRLVIKAAVVFTRLTTGLNLTDAHNGLSDEHSEALNARLILLLANHIGDLRVLREALQAARQTD